MPIEIRLAAPAPVANARGATPKIVENAVIKIGRKRNLDASIAALVIDIPWSRNWLANSTIKIEFLVAKPINIINPMRL